MRVLNAIVTEDGGVRLLDSIRLRTGQRLAVTVLDEDGDAGDHDIRRLEGIFQKAGRVAVSVEEMNEAIRNAGVKA